MESGPRFDKGVVCTAGGGAGRATGDGCSGDSGGGRCSRCRGFCNDIEGLRRDVQFAELRQLHEAGVLRVARGKRLVADVLTEDVDEDVMPPNAVSLPLDVVGHPHDPGRPHVDPGLLTGLPDGGLFDRLANLDRAAGHAPEPSIRRGAAPDEEDLGIPEHDRAYRGDRSQRKFVRGHGLPPKAFRPVQRCPGPTSGKSSNVLWYRTCLRTSLIRTYRSIGMSNRVRK